MRLTQLLLSPAFLLLAACNNAEPPALPSIANPPPLVGEGPITPIPNDMKLDADKVALGRALFVDRRLSRDSTISCAHCHPLDRYGVDGLPASVGIDGRQGRMNAPSVYNSAYNFRQFWDGRAYSLEEQADGPLTNPDEMDSSWPLALSRLNEDASIQALAQRALGKPLDADGARSALATFERSLVTPDAPFDRFLRGDEQALEPRARAGWRLFNELGCVSCHQGANVGGNMYSRIGVFETYFTKRAPERSDFGRYNITGKEKDMYRFKVPSLRNVARTAPYFHDGGIATLPEAVETMAKTQLGLQLAPEERDLLVAFLENLTGRLPERTP